MGAQSKIGGDYIGLRPTLQDDGNPLIRAAEDGTLTRKLKRYVKSCRPPTDTDSKKETGRLPTMAGFCSQLQCGTSSVLALQQQYPRLFEYLCAVLEDEALNSGRSPAIVNAYLKEHFGYGEKLPEGEDEAMRLIFEHDILEDGA